MVGLNFDCKISPEGATEIYRETVAFSGLILCFFAHFSAINDGAVFDESLQDKTESKTACHENSNARHKIALIFKN